MNLREQSKLKKYKGGLHYYLRNELALFEVQSINEAGTKEMYLEKHDRKPRHHQQYSQKEKGKSHKKSKQQD